jgi:hypothetical protein
MRMTSTKTNCVIIWLVVIYIPWNSPVLTAFKISLFSPSATSKNNSGERGKNWWSHFLEMKKGEVAPFMRIAKETDDMQALIHLMKGISNPRWVRSNLI